MPRNFSPPSGRSGAAAEDRYAPVFVSSAIAQLLCEDMKTLGQLSAYEPLVTFEQEQQKLEPYGVVWVNSDPLDLSGGHLWGGRRPTHLPRTA